MLTIRDLSVGYRGPDVVHHLDMEVAAGEIVALLGPNGAGKSTTLRAISGLLPWSSGDVVLDGRSIRRVRPDAIARSGLVHVTEERSVFMGLTVEQNLRLAARVTGRGRAALDEALEIFPALEALMGRRAGLLSGGEQQMATLARALVVHPKVLMVDELSLGLAPIIIDRLLPVLRSAADSGVAVLLVEQHVHQALAVADRAYVLRRGVVVAEGPADRLAADGGLLRASYLG